MITCWNDIASCKEMQDILHANLNVYLLALDIIVTPTHTNILNIRIQYLDNTK